MAVPFYVPNDGGSATDVANANNSAISNNSTRSFEGRDSTRQQDPLLGALCEALYRVLLARQGQGSAFTLPPPPSPTCSPHQPNQHLSEVFFPSGTVLPLETNHNQNNQNYISADQQPTSANHPQHINSPTTTGNNSSFYDHLGVSEINGQVTGVNAGGYYDQQQLLLNSSHDQYQGDGSNQNQQQGGNAEINNQTLLTSHHRVVPRRRGGLQDPQTVVLTDQQGPDIGADGCDGLRMFQGRVPLSTRRRLCPGRDAIERNIAERKGDDSKDDRTKECLTWPVVTALLVAVGCGILRATR